MRGVGLAFLPVLLAASQSVSAQQIVIPEIYGNRALCNLSDPSGQPLAIQAGCLMVGTHDRPAQIDEGAELFRQAIRLATEEGASETAILNLRLKLLFGYALAGMTPEMLEQASLLPTSLRSAENLRCSVFARIMRELEAHGPSSAAQTLNRHYGLDSCPGYVPTSGWERRRGPSITGLYEVWFGENLIAMGEPTLARNADLEGAMRRFRYSYYPEYAPAVAIRIDQYSPEQFVLNWTKLDGAAGFWAGEIAHTGSRDLNAVEASAFRNALEAARLAEMPRETIDEDTGGPCTKSVPSVFEELTRNVRAFVISDARCLDADHPLMELETLVAGFVPQGIAD